MTLAARQPELQRRRADGATNGLMVKTRKRAGVIAIVFWGGGGEDAHDDGGGR